LALLRHSLVASLLFAISAVAVFADGNADVVETFLKAADQTDIRSVSYRLQYYVFCATAMGESTSPWSEER
jgi:hypothetical protein